MNQINKKYQSSLAGIDLLRFLLSMCIVIFHYRMFLRPFSGNSKVPTSKLPLNNILGLIYEHGGYAVEIFWLISGFIFYRIYATAIYEKNVGFKHFSLLRFSRLYPLHFATLIIVAILQYAYKSRHWVYFGYPTNDVMSFIRHLFFVNKWGNFGLSFNGPVWSVSIEIFVYLLFFVVCLLGFLKGRKIFIAVIVAALCYFFHFPSPFHECIYYFFSGCLLCYWYNKGYSSGLLLTAYILTALLSGGLTIYGNTTGNTYDTLRTTTGIAASSLLLLAFIYLFSKVRSQRMIALLKWCGDITYSTYLVHFPIMLMLSLLANPQNDAMFQSPMCLGLFVILVIVVGTLTYRLYERPVQTWLRNK